MAGLPGDGEVIEKSRLRRDLAIAGIAVVTLGVIVGLNFDEVVDGLSQITFAEAFGLVSLHLLALVLRAIAWGLCLDAAGSRVPPRELHATSGPRFLADTVVPDLRRRLGADRPPEGDDGSPRPDRSAR